MNSYNKSRAVTRFLLRTVVIIVVIGGQRRWAYASLAACHCMLFYVRCMFIDTWQINSLSLSQGKRAM